MSKIYIDSDYVVNMLKDSEFAASTLNSIIQSIAELEEKLHDANRDIAQLIFTNRAERWKTHPDGNSMMPFPLCMDSDQRVVLELGRQAAHRGNSIFDMLDRSIKHGR